VILSYKTVSLKERSDLQGAHLHLNVEVWPEFLLNCPNVDAYWMQMYETFGDYQLMIMDGEEILAGINSVPIFYDKNLNELSDEGVEWGVAKSINDHEAGLEPNLLVGLQIMIRKEHQGKGLSSIVLNEMSNLAKSKGFRDLVIPVRPNLKEHYPLIPMKEYIEWKNDKGLPFDNWLRVHVRAGGKILHPCEKSGTILGKIDEWKQWTKQNFPGSGKYVVPGALSPISIDLKEDEGVYVEPNVWVQHKLR
jgi:hypothetical protein